MVLKKICAPLALAMLLVACERSNPPEEKGNKPATAPASNGNDKSIGKPDLIPPELTPPAERGEKGARNVLLTFAKAIEFKRFGQAWDLLSPSDKQKWSKTEFAAIFSDLTKASVAIPDGKIEGAAGSIYYNAPITITGSDSDGRPVRIEGEAVLRRVNDVDGATQAQLRWHFHTLDLRWTH